MDVSKLSEYNKGFKYSQQQLYSSTCDNTCDFSLDLTANFYHFMLVINSIKPNYHNLTNNYIIKLQ